MSSTVSQIGKNAGQSPAQWLLEDFELNLCRGRRRRDVNTARQIIQLIEDHWDECSECRYLDNDEDVSFTQLMRWLPGDPIVP